MEYGKRIRALREAKKISIYRLSQDSGISQGHISDLENGKETVELGKAMYLANLLGMDLVLQDRGEV